MDILKRRAACQDISQEVKAGCKWVFEKDSDHEASTESEGIEVATALTSIE